MNDCDARCGYCGRCEGSDEEPTSPGTCLWCQDGFPHDEDTGATYSPYCSSLCAAQAERDSEEEDGP